MTKSLLNRVAIRNFIFLFSFLTIISTSIKAQSFKGKDGARSYTFPGTYILNRYTTLSSSVVSGSLTIVVSDITDLSGSNSFTNSTNPYTTNALSKGDLIMIVQVQGADIAITDDADYGRITDYNTTGNYELKTVFGVSGNIISLCENLTHSYNQLGRSRTQIVRVPRLSSLTVGAGATISGLAWTGTEGGIVSIETSNDINLNGSISATGIGFRGGIDDIQTSSPSGGTPVVFYRTTVTTTSAGKGESIAGSNSDYITYLNGANGRGAPANGGGGGNGHNSGGGGGSNAGVNGALVPWNGTGIKSNATATWATAWNFESASFANDTSVGAGRGGYSYSNSNQDALVLPPGSSAWGGDKRNIVGGFGARPLNYNGDSRLFIGGGGGAGDGNNASAGNAGNGGGIIYLLSNGSISGTGTIVANGQNGFNTKLLNIDAAGGGGGGGAIIAMAKGTITGVEFNALGGNGGNQLFLTTETEGPGGGGGGGYIATSTTSVNRNTFGGENGITNSTQLTEFLPNGATKGSAGTVASKPFSDVYACTEGGYVLPVNIESFTAAISDENKIAIKWIAQTQTENVRFEIQRSFDGIQFSTIGSQISSTGSSNYTYNDVMDNASIETVYYRLKMIGTNSKPSYSTVQTIKIKGQQNTLAISTFPNPATKALHIALPLTWIGKKVKIEIYDVAGKLSASTERSSATQLENLNINNFSAGIYLIRATMGSEIAQQRFLKNK